MTRRSVLDVVTVAVLLLQTAACGGSSDTPSSPTRSPLPLAAESSNFRYYYSPGDTVQIERQEAFHAWAVARLGVTLPQRVDFRKYTSRDDMGSRTGRYNTNAYAEPELFTLHTLWTWDNHETVHIYTALVGRPSDFFNEGIAVAFQTNPLDRDFEPRFNGEQVHDAARRYRQLGQLVLPLSRVVTTSGFRAVSDSVLSYREAGSFVAFLIDRFGLDRVLAFFRASTRDDALSVIESRFQQVFGTALADAESEWLAFVGEQPATPR
jgi:hypothetical protein